ncbi:AI-2E family transporter [Gemmata sp.]|uniref:AI-2E family transporter n=1 Tax=Gemmata sp. TaxID=1914242 RepID=UPI003F7081AD
MSHPHAPPPPVDPPERRQFPRWRDPTTATAIATVAHVLVAGAAGWFLLQQLAPVVRPLLVAVFLAYILLPYHSRLRHHIGGAASIGVLAGATAGVLFGLALVVYVSLLGLSEDVPHLHARAGELLHAAEGALGNLPGWAAALKPSEVPLARIGSHLSQATGVMISLAAGTLVEAVVIAMYLLFLLLEGSRFPDRVRRAYPPERAEEILQIAGQVSSAIVSYLRVKVRSSLILAVPVGLILWAFGVKFATLWALLTFLCNFIPYIGPVVAYSLPVGFGFLWFGMSWEPVAVAVLLMCCHAASAAVVEPTMIGNAVGLSPLVLLAALAFWGLLWGIPGMFLAVPLTVVSVIVMNHFESSRAVAGLLRGE